MDFRLRVADDGRVGGQVRLHAARRSGTPWLPACFQQGIIVNWGTRGSPCPTLNLEPFAGALCIGIAFEFPEARRAEVEAYLAKREGRGFMLAPLEVIVKGVGSAHALVPLYTGKNILTPETMQGLVATVQQACGTSGACSDYVIDVHNQLAKLGIVSAIT